MTDLELLKLLNKGIFPLEGESEDAFLLRAEKYPYFQGEQEQKEAGQITEKLFSFSINWMPVVYSNKKLSFWEGAAAWIDPNAFPYVQLRKEFQKGHHLKVLRKEILAHEAVHAVRMHYEEPVFEEFLAYQTSEKKWRRLLGPLFRYPLEATVFVITLGVGVCCTYFELFIGLLLPITLLTYYLIRLAWNSYFFYRAAKNYPLAVLVWLKDREIRKGRLQFQNRQDLRERALHLLFQQS